MSSEGVLEPLEALAPLQGAPRGEAQSRWQALPWPARIVDAVSSYLPMLLMGLLALGSWWLVKNTPVPEEPPAATPVRHEPDYTMHAFSVQRFTAEGRLRAQIEGETLRHFPDTDTFEIERPSVQGHSPDGSLTLATAQRALANADASEVQLLGGARVTRSAATPGEEGLSFRGEFLHAFLKTERLHSPLPVTMARGGTVIRADSFDYDHLQRTVAMKGHVRASFATSPLGSASRTPARAAP
jgi:lipopolysaccharide export system protein LptC